MAIGPSSTKALVLDAHHKSSLAAIRSLGQKGITVSAGSHRPTAMGLCSRYLGDTFIYPPPLRDRCGFVEAVRQQSNRIGKAVLLTFSDSTLLPLVEATGLLGDQLLYTLPFNRAHFDLAFDKALTLRLAQEMGLETPITFFDADLDDPCICSNLSYPLVVKPRRSVHWNGNSGVLKTADFACAFEDLKRQFRMIVSRTGECPVIQEYVFGEQASAEFLCDRGHVLAACAHRRLRSISPRGGASVVSETIPLTYHGIKERAERLVSKLCWSGPIMIEFKVSQKDGVPRLMEINGRFWGSLPLAIFAGVDFPYLHYQLACGQPFTPSIPYRSGITSRHYLGDFENLLRVLFKHDEMRQWVYPSRSRALKDFFSSSKSCIPEIFDWRDVKPALAEMFDIFSLSLEHLARPMGDPKSKTSPD
jgi:predicted ATP-grasp superfamily ATP-dependent carboligase